LAAGIDEVVALRKAGHPGPTRFLAGDATPRETGFVLEFEER
jgi:hypothetical protein